MRKSRVLGVYFLFVVFCSAALMISVSGAKAAVYDDFDGDRINQALWSSDDDSGHRFSQSGGFLNADGPPNMTEYRIDSTWTFHGDFEFVLDYSDFQSTATVFTDPEDAKRSVFPQLTLQVTQANLVSPTGYDENYIFILRALGEEGDPPTPIHRFLSGGTVGGGINYGPDAASSPSGSLKIGRVGSAITTYYSEGSWVRYDEYPGAFTEDVRVSISADTGVNGSFHVSCDRITFTGQGTPPVEIILNGTVFNPGNPLTATFKLNESITQPFTAFAVIILPRGLGMLDMMTLKPKIKAVATGVQSLPAGFTCPLLSVVIPPTAPKGEYELLVAFFNPSKPITGRADARGEVSAKFTIQ